MPRAPREARTDAGADRDSGDIGSRGLTAADRATLTPVDLAQRIAGIASDRKAIDIRMLDLREIVSYTDYFVICSGNTDRQTKAIHDAVRQGLKHGHGLLPRRVEGEREARWILMDYLDCVVHIFTPDARAYYRLEQLWGEAPTRTVT
jgi:ribosome-associated protein